MVDTYLKSKNIYLNGRRTSVRLEPAILAGLEFICKYEGITMTELVRRAMANRPGARPVNALREYPLEWFRRKAGMMD
jgi:predicted DNA-binding ribbon-helix-helix protein